MKNPFWHQDSDVEIIEPTKEAQKNYGHNCGSSTILLSQDEFMALSAGKMIAFNDGEYSTFIVRAM